MESRFVDLSHPIESGLRTYPGLPTPVITGFMSHEDSRTRYADGTEFQIGRIEMVSNTGTYLDAPFHRFAGAADLSTLPLESLADLPGVVLSAPQTGRSIHTSELPSDDWRGHAVLFHTGWSRHWSSERYFEGHPFLSSDVAAELVRREVALVGIDSLNIDDTDDGTRPVHTALLAASIPVVEHLTHLARLPRGSFRFFAVPVKVKGMGTFPVRAFALTGG